MLSLLMFFSTIGLSDCTAEVMGMAPRVLRITRMMRSPRFLPVVVRMYLGQPSPSG